MVASLFISRGRICSTHGRAVGDWEGGLTYPKAEHLKQFVVIAFEHQAFPAGREAAGVRALWQAARQKVLLDDCLQVLAPQALRDMSASLESRQGLLLEYLRSSRVLLVYDNLESFLDEGEDTGHMRPGYQGFARVLRRIAETEHQSCLLLTSREKPGALVPLEGSRAPLRALRLARLDADSCRQLLAEKDVAGTASELAQLIEVYAGNPLALKIVAQTIVDLFDGRITLFLEQGEVVFGSVRELVRGSFTLQSVVLEYATGRLIAEASREIEQGTLSRLIEHGLDLSQLAIRGAYLQGVEMQDASLAEALLRDTTFTEAFDATRVVAISRNGTYWAAGSRRGKARVWQEGGKLLHLAWQAHTDTVAALPFSPDGRTLATGSWNGAITLWDIESGTLLWTSWHTTNIQSLAFAPDGSLLASGGNDATVRLWEATSGTHRQALSGKSGPVYALAWSPDGSLLASGSADGTLRVWDVERGQCVHIIQGYAVSLYDVAWSPDGTRLASCSDDGSVCLWEASDGTLLTKLQGHHGMVASVAWSPDGTRLASGGGSRGSGELVVWDAQSGERLQALSEPSAIVYALAWSPTGAVLMWDLQSGKQLRTLRRDRPHERLNITGIRGVTEAQKTTLRALGAIEDSPS